MLISQTASLEPCVLEISRAVCAIERRVIAGRMLLRSASLDFILSNQKPADNLVLSIAVVQALGVFAHWRGWLSSLSFQVR